MIVNRNLIRPGGNLIYPTGYEPGFDPTHVAARQVVCSAVPLGSLFYDPRTALNSHNTAGTFAAATLGGIGPCVDFTSSGAIAFPSTISNATRGTIAAIFQQKTTNAGVILMSVWGTGGAGSWMDVTAGGNLELTCAGAGNTAYAAISLNVPYFSAISFVGSDHFDWVLLRLDNGQLKYGTTAIAYSPSLLASQIGIGGYNATTLNFKGYVSAALCSNAYVPLPQLLQWAADPWSFWYPKSKPSVLASTSSSLNLTASQSVPSFTSSETLAAIIAAGASQNVPVFSSTEALASYIAATVSQTIPAFTGTESLIDAVTGVANVGSAQTISGFTLAETLAALASAQSGQTISAFTAAEALAALVKAQVAATLPAFGQTFSAVVLSALSISGAQVIPGFPQVVTVSDRKKNTTVYIII